MTELEKAASGLLYDANSDPALLEARAQTSDLCMDYNALRSSQKVPVRPISSLSRRFLSITAAIRVSAVHFMQTITL